MAYTRRDIGKLALGSIAGMNVIGPLAAVASAARAAKPKSTIGGVEIGAISYCFRQISYNPEDVLKAMRHLELNVVELEQSFFEHYLGAPPDPTGGGQPAGVGRVPAGGPFGIRSTNAPPPSEVPSVGRGAPGTQSPQSPQNPQSPAGGIAGGGSNAAGEQGAAGQGGTSGAARGQGARGGRGSMTPEQETALKVVRADLRKWRMSAPMDKAKSLRKLYDDGGVEIRLIKFPQLGGPEMTDEEVDYCFLLAKTMNARGITCEPPVSSAKRVARFADKHKMIVGYHGHSNATGVENFGRTGAWEQAFFYSTYNWANVDVGHFMAGNSFAPADFIREYHDRITNLHLKDRKINQGPNMPWGQGDTPIKEILQLMKREKYTFPAMIEMEYPTPPTSSVMDEMARCVQYCKDALA